VKSILQKIKIAHEKSPDKAAHSHISGLLKQTWDEYFSEKASQSQARAAQSSSNFDIPDHSDKDGKDVKMEDVKHSNVRFSSLSFRIRIYRLCRFSSSSTGAKMSASLRSRPLSPTTSSSKASTIATARPSRSLTKYPFSSSFHPPWFR
jgi:hypothetical protein